MPNNKSKSKTKSKSQRQHQIDLEEKKLKIESQLKKFGEQIYEDLDKQQFPTIHFPSRSVRNIVYDGKTRQYILGSNTVSRNASNIKHIRPFTQMTWLAFFARELLTQKKSSTLRDVFYSSQAYAVDYENQSESDSIITDFESLISIAREQLHIYPEERSAIFGDLDIEYTVPGYEGNRLNLSSHPDGYLIGPSLGSADFIDTSAEMVIAIEKGGLFNRFVEEKVHKKYKSIIIDTAGQAPRATRYMLKRLHNELNLPVYIMTDGDVYGEHIAMVIVSGSAGAAHLRELTVPSAKWLGIWASDIDKYKLPTIPMTDIDLKRISELKRDPRYKKGIWNKELDVFLDIKKKCELEAFSKYGLTTIVDKYLPEKLEQAKSM